MFSWNLNLLSPWGDEVFTLRVIQLPWSDIPPVLAADIHPPLYYFLLKLWAGLAGPGDAVIPARAFSVAWSVAAAFLFERLWLRDFPMRVRLIALGLFAFSPMLLLYGRMARSYTMQCALAIVAVAALRSVVKGRSVVWGAAALALLLYTHYVPALALAVGFAVAAVGRVPWHRLAAVYSLAGLAYLPWALTLGQALDRWKSASHFAANYALTGSGPLEHLLKIGFASFTLMLGETVGPLSILGLFGFAYAGWRSMQALPGLRRRTLIGVATVVAIGYIGVSRWVTFPFIGARLLWLLPGILLLLAITLRRHPVLLACLAIAYASGIAHYFRLEGFLNKGYVAPLREIARTLNEGSAPGDQIWLDGYNMDATALSALLDPPARSVAMELHPGKEPLPGPGATWFFGSTRDVSPGRLNTRAIDIACGSAAPQTWYFVPYEPWLQAALHRLSPPAPAYAYRLLRCDPRPSF